MKMYFKYCDHEKNGSKLLLLVDKEISLRTCGTETSGRGFPNSNEGDLLEGLDPGKNGHRTFSRRTWSWLKGLHKRPSTFTVPKDASIFAGVRSKVSDYANSEQEVGSRPAPKEVLDVDMARILNQF